MSQTQKTETKTVIIGGFDGHGTSTSIAMARSNSIPPNNLILAAPDIKSKNPGTSPEGLANIINTLMLFKNDVYIVDIPINIKDPSSYLNSLDVLSRNNNVVVIDHHSSNLKFLQYVPSSIKFLQFGSSVEMYNALLQSGLIASSESELALIGIITDRDPQIRTLHLDEKQFNTLYDIANVYDFLIRQDFNTVISKTMENGIEYIKGFVGNVQYPPKLYVKNFQVLEKGPMMHLVKFNKITGWMWKTVDEYLRQNGLDYVVFVTTVDERSTGGEVPVVGVAQYWLSSQPSPRTLVVNQMPQLQKRKIIGHEAAFTITAVSIEEAEELGRQIYNSLSSSYSSTASLISVSSMSNAIQRDYMAILNRLNDILELQTKMYQEYLGLKREQVNLLKQTSGQNNNNVRYD